MATYEFAAKHNIHLEANDQITKGERLTMNIHTMAARPFNVFSTPESRRQAIQQFAVNGIDIKPKGHLLNTGHWNIEQVPNEAFHKATDIHSFEPTHDFRFPWKDMSGADGIIDDVSMKKGCIESVREFFAEGRDVDFAEKGLEGRCEIVSSFYDDIKQQMGINAELDFVHKPACDLGCYNPSTNRIELNARYLEDPDCSNLLNTVLHESRHAFQNKCIETPESVTVKGNIIDVWKDNFNNYISAADDFEAYENQEIEKDANYFADSVMKKGTGNYYA